MCGFFGAFGLAKGPLTPEGRAKIAKALVHRGPDDFQLLDSPLYQILFCRLSIVDEIGGKQPMLSPDGSTIVLFNGEVYNYQSLRHTLQAQGVEFKTRSDAEVVLLAYKAWGESCFNHFEGMFAVCIVDCTRNKIVLARDRLGVKPLYFRQDKEGLTVASEQKAILASIDELPELDYHSLLNYIVFQTVLGAKTLFKGISKVPAGFVFVFDLQTQEFRHAQQIQPACDVPLQKTYEDYSRLTREFFIQQVKSALDTELPICFHLSGGFDSNLLVALCRYVNPQRKFICVSSLVEGEKDGEWDPIRMSAGHHGCPLEVVNINEDNFFQAFEDVIYYLDEPVGDPGVVAQFLVNRQASRNGKIVFSGQGLDEMYFGYIRNLAAYTLATYGPKALDSDNPEFSKLASSTRQFLRGWEDFLKPIQNNPSISPAFFYFKKLCRFDPFVKAEGLDEGFLGPLREVALETYVHYLKRGASLHDFMFFAETELQLPALLHMEDRASMRYAIETRVPFCTASIFDLAKSSDIHWKFNGGSPKGLLKDIFKDLLPEHILSRQCKVGRPIPLRRWLQGKLGRQYAEGLKRSGEIFRDLTGLDFVGYALNHPNPYDRSVWAILSLSKWMELYKVRV